MISLPGIKALKIKIKTAKRISHFDSCRLLKLSTGLFTLIIMPKCSGTSYCKNNLRTKDYCIHLCKIKLITLTVGSLGRTRLSSDFLLAKFETPFSY